MDDADVAEKHQRAEIQRAIRNRRPTLPYTGNCHWCDAPVGPRQQFCDADCRDDYEQHERRHK